MTKAGERLIAAAREARDALDKIEVGIPTSEIESAGRLDLSETTMTKLEHQKAAVYMAVRSALHKIGSERIGDSEFFGTNQPKTERRRPRRSGAIRAFGG